MRRSCLERWKTSSLQGASCLAIAYLCAGELLPLPAIKASTVLQAWAVKEVVLIAFLSILAVLAAMGGSGGAPSGAVSTAALLAAINIVPVVAAVVTASWISLSDNCPYRLPADSKTTLSVHCDHLGVVLDVVGLISARLARLNLGISLLLAVRGESSWLFSGATGWLGYAEAVPLHRTAGWWCASQSAVHSTAYLLFYVETGGLRALWLNCFPAPSPDETLNRLGLINFLGLVALVALSVLILPALPWFRRRVYHVFQLVHLPAAMLFVVCCALHDLPILLFALPGLAGWYHEWSERGRSRRGRRLPAKGRLLAGTSGSWVELTIECGADHAADMSSGRAPRGRWASLRVLPLGRESHPLSLTASQSSNATELVAVVSARAGDWSTALVELSRPGCSSFNVELAGPYPFGGGDWSLYDDGRGADREASLLLLAGGTGIVGWLPGLALADARDTSRRCHLVWCVQRQVDYLALAGRLPPSRARLQVTIYVTRPDGTGGLDPPAALLAAVDEAIAVDETAAIDEPSASVRASASVLRSWLRHRSDSLMIVSLVVTLVGLAVGLWGWKYLADVLSLPRIPMGTGWFHTTLTGYLISRRCLPIVLIAASMLVTTAICRRFVSHARPRARCGRCCPAYLSDTELRVTSSRREPEKPIFTGTSSSAPQPLQTSDSTGPPDEAVDQSHDMRVGRPDFDALVRAATAGLAGKQRVVVAACGPETMVAAARTAVVAARKECRGVRLEFSGSKSTW